jgi:hypothetical protein
MDPTTEADPVGLHPTTLVVALQALATDEVSQTHGIGPYMLIRPTIIAAAGRTCAGGASGR